MENFGDRLAQAVRRWSNPVCVGLDPRWDSLPETLRGDSDLPGRAKACGTFCREVIDTVAGLVPIVKPQAAFFEQLGPPGMAELALVIQHARRAGLLVIADCKRNDIGSTAEAYADGWLGQRSAWQADALTVSPYLGSDSLEPFAKTAQQRGSGIFVLVKTSNPGAGQFQDLPGTGRSVYEHVATEVEALSARTAGTSGFGCVGAVVGATYPDQLVALRRAMPHAWLLVPGYGAQGGSSRDVKGAFDERGLGGIVNNSRGLIFAYARREFAGYASWQAAVEAATRDMIEQLRSATNAGKLGS